MLGQGATLLEDGRSLLFVAAHPPAQREDLVTCLQGHVGPLALVRDAGRQLAHAAPVSQSFARIGQAGPFGGAPVPACRTARVARFGPVLCDLGGALVEVAACFLEGLRHRGVYARLPLA